MEKDKDENKGKTGNIPNEQIKGSDADKAYNENGKFGQPATKEKNAERSEVPPGSDADSPK